MFKDIERFSKLFVFLALCLILLFTIKSQGLAFKDFSYDQLLSWLLIGFIGGTTSVALDRILKL